MDINRLNNLNGSLTPLMSILNIINSPIIISNPNNILNRSWLDHISAYRALGLVTQGRWWLI